MGRRFLMLYLDRELEPDQALGFETHLDTCQECAGHLERNRKVEDLLENTLSPLTSPEMSAAFLDKVRLRLEGDAAAKEDSSAGPDQAQSRPTRIPRRSLRILWAAAGAAAAAIILVWSFHQQEEAVPAKRAAIADSGKPHIVADTRTTAEEAKERLLARQELRAVLEKLSGIPDADLCRSFEEGTTSLKSKGWRIDILLCRALLHEEDQALRSAIRLAGRWSGFASVPRAIDSLERLLKERRYPLETMTALAALDGPRAEAALGKALLDQELRYHALACLESMPGDGPAFRIAKALPIDRRSSQEPLSIFETTALAALSRMGPRGVKGILEFMGRHEPDEELVRSVSMSGSGFGRELAALLPGLRGQKRDAALRIAASLRLEEALPLMRRAAERSSLEPRILALITSTGGPHAVKTLVEIYQGPVSLRERRRIAAALVRTLSLYPDELESTMQRAFELLPAEQGGLIPELLAMEGTGEACRALAWIVGNQPGISVQAAFELARTGSDEALPLLLALIEGERLPQEAQAAASAAAILLGGRETVESILGEGARISGKGSAGSGRPGRITDSRFRRLLEIIEQHPSSKNSATGG